MNSILRTENVKELPRLLGRNLTFLKQWADANEEQFEKIMQLFAEEKPEKWADIYMKVQQTINQHDTQKQTVNVRLSKDFDTLRALAQTTLNRSLSAKQADYEEIQEG